MWQLMSCLPPSVEYLKLLEANTIKMSGCYLLHTIRWTPRLGHRVFVGWTKVHSMINSFSIIKTKYFLFFFILNLVQYA